MTYCEPITGALQQESNQAYTYFLAVAQIRELLYAGWAVLAVLIQNFNYSAESDHFSPLPCCSTLLRVTFHTFRLSYSYLRIFPDHQWNSLSEQLLQPDITFGQFERSLKTFMFGQLDRGALCLNVKDQKSSYLLTRAGDRQLAVLQGRILQRGSGCLFPGKFLKLQFAVGV